MYETLGSIPRTTKIEQSPINATITTIEEKKLVAGFWIFSSVTESKFLPRKQFYMMLYDRFSDLSFYIAYVWIFSVFYENDKKYQVGMKIQSIFLVLKVKQSWTVCTRLPSSSSVAWALFCLESGVE